MSFAAAVAAAVGTAVWSMLAAKASLATIVLAVALVGATALVIALFSTLTHDAKHTDIDFGMVVVMALVFAAYQSAAYAAFQANGAASQAVINCNVVIIVAHNIATADVVTTESLATAAAIVLYVALGWFIAYYK